MIHIATVHWRDDRWIDIQLSALDRHIHEPFRVYAFLNGIDEAHDSKFFYASHEPITDHAIKLNLLGDIIKPNASPDDLVIFIDGDAWPIVDFLPLVRAKLAEFPLVAVCRKENLGDIQPHPCFTITTVGYWHAIKGDWKQGYTWEVVTNGRTVKVTDVGGNLLGLLRQQNAHWYPLLRSNTVDLHPLWFGVYGDILYHHGAGFRPHISRLDAFQIAQSHPLRSVIGGEWIYRPNTLTNKVLKKALGYSRLIHAQQNKNAELSQRIIKAIKVDIDFPAHFIESNATPDKLAALLAR